VATGAGLVWNRRQATSAPSRYRRVELTAKTPRTVEPAVGYEKRWRGHRLTLRVVRRRPPREIGGKIGSHGGVHTIVVSRGCLSAFVFGFRLAWFPFPACSQPLWTLQRDPNGFVTPLTLFVRVQTNRELSRPKSRGCAKQDGSARIEPKRHGRLALPRNRNRIAIWGHSAAASCPQCQAPLRNAASRLNHVSNALARAHYLDDGHALRAADSQSQRVASANRVGLVLTGGDEE